MGRELIRYPTKKPDIEGIKRTHSEAAAPVLGSCTFKRLPCVNNEDLTDAYLPIGTPLVHPDGHYVAIGMDVEGPFSQDEARDRLNHLKKATRVELEDEDRRKQEN
jgi:hypothetical protein